MQYYKGLFWLLFNASLKTAPPAPKVPPKQRKLVLFKMLFSQKEKNTEKKLLTSLIPDQSRNDKCTPFKKHMDLPCSQSCSFSSVALLVEMIHKYSAGLSHHPSSLHCSKPHSVATLSLWKHSLTPPFSQWERARWWPAQLGLLVPHFRTGWISR